MGLGRWLQLRSASSVLVVAVCLTGGVHGLRPTALRPSATETAGAARACRTFYAHGEAEGKDGVEYSTLLVWREHARRLEGSPPGTQAWRLSVNVTATEGGRVMLGSAARALPGQARYEVVLAARAGGCRLVDQAAKVNATPTEAVDASLALFDDGELQLWLAWTVTDTTQLPANDSQTARAGATVHGLLEVAVMPAGASAETQLFSYRTAQPIQLDTFSFGTTAKGDAGFTVCTTSGAGEPGELGDGAQGVTGDGSGLGVAGCRSLLVHVHSTHAHEHNLGLAWPDTADRHGRLQFWARASTDVEVDVGERVNTAGSQHSYHAVLGGDFNSRSWAVHERRRVAVVDSPALLSEFQFRALWVAVSPAGTLSVGVGEAGVAGVAGGEHHHRPAPREIFSWRHPHRPEPKFVSFQTFRQRLVHILIDCVRSPSQAPSQPYPADLLDAVWRHVSSGQPHQGALEGARAPALRLNLTSLTLHNGTGVAAGFLIMEWQHFKKMEWNPYWFENVEKIEFWPKTRDGDEKAGDRRAVNGVSIRALSFNQSQSGMAALDSWSLEINANKLIFQKFPLSLKFPCKEKLFEVACSITLQLNSTCLSDLSHIRVSSHLNHKWHIDWKIISQNQTGNAIVSLKLMTHHQNYSEDSLLSRPYAHQTKQGDWLSFIYVILTIAALITIILGNKSSAEIQDSIGYSVLFRMNQKINSKEKHEILLDGIEQETAHIVGTDSQQMRNEPEVKQQYSSPLTMHSLKELSFLRHLRFRNINQVRLTVIFIAASLFLSVLDLILRVKHK